MQINGAANSVIFNRSNTNQIVPVAKNQDMAGSKQIISNYDVHNMSPDDLRKMANELHESGQISERDRILLVIEADVMTDFGGVSKDTKIDMVDRFNKRLAYEKSEPEPSAQNIMSLERSLDILRGIESRRGVNFPLSA